MRVILIGGGETIETIYFLTRLFTRRGHKVTVIDRNSAEAKTLSRRVRATIIVGDGSAPDVLEQAGARRADALLSLSPYDPDNLVACQIAKKLYGVPRTMALVNDPDNEDVFRRLGISIVFSATRIIGGLIESHTVNDEITHLFPAAEGRAQVVDVELTARSPAAGKCLRELELPVSSMVACIIRGEDIMVPREDSRVLPSDHLILIMRPDDRDEVLSRLTGEGD